MTLLPIAAAALAVAYVRKRLLYWVHVGDGRLYLFREGNLMRITQDHTIPGQLLAEGEITEENDHEAEMKESQTLCRACSEH